MLRTPVVAVFFLVAGCGDPTQVVVKGTVTFAGTPVETGSISFFPEPGTESRKASAPIVNGIFEISPERAPSAGSFRIEISWMKKTGMKIPSADPGMDDLDERQEAIPAKYNSDSTLVRDIVRGENKLEFTLEP